MTTSANHPMAWADLGACRGEDHDLFYPPVPPEKITGLHVALARPICQACPVYAACHAHAVQRESDGIWAATSPRDRRRLRKAMGLVDRFDLASYRAQPAGRRQVHARRNTSTLLVFRLEGAPR